MLGCSPYTSDTLAHEVVNGEVAAHYDDYDEERAEVSPWKEGVEGPAFDQHSDVVDDGVDEAVVDHVAVVAGDKDHAGQGDIEEDGEGGEGVDPDHQPVEGICKVQAFGLG